MRKAMSDDIWQSYLDCNSSLPIEQTPQALKSTIDIHLQYIPTDSQNILDIGAGDGYASNCLMNRGKNVTAVSINTQEVEYMVSRGINAAEEDMLHKNIKKIRLEVSMGNIPALNLYKKSGFRIKSILKNYYFNEHHGTHDAFRMIKDLTT